MRQPVPMEPQALAQLCLERFPVTSLPPRGGVLGASAASSFNELQYGREFQLSTTAQIAVCVSRAWKLHIRDKSNFIMFVAAYTQVHAEANCGYRCWVVRRVGITMTC